MKMYFKHEYKSINTFEEIELANYSVITGLNGSGKTQMLEALQKGMIGLRENGVELASIRLLNGGAMAPKHYMGLTQEEVERRQRNELVSKTESIKSIIDEIKLGYNVERGLDYQIIEKLSKLINKPILEIENQDIQEHIVEASNHFEGLESDSFFDHDFSLIIWKYQLKRMENMFNQFLAERLGKDDVHYISDEEFRVQNPEPWLLLNTLMREANLDYKVKEPVGYPMLDPGYEFKLISLSNGSEVRLYDLSSGEKVIMSLVFSLYNRDYNFLFPSVLLLDEPDASLHPLMTKQFLDVVINFFVRELGVKVIMTTHSSSTVALAPEDSLYVVSRTGPRIMKTTKDEALKVLTTGVPSFSVNYENRRQVFVESRFDVIYFEKLYNLLSAHLEAEISLTFIASGESRTDRNGMKVSNCEQVQNITKMLREGGNNFVFGVIDWDGSNVSEGGVFVLGEGQRDNIESYLLDPIVLACVLIREGIMESEDLGLSPSIRYVDFENLSAEEIQLVSDSVTELIFPLKSEAADVKGIECELMCGKKYNLAEKYAKMDGHELEETVLKAFPKLHDIKRGDEGKLKLHILDRVLGDVPDLLSIDILNVFKKIQEA